MPKCYICKENISFFKIFFSLSPNFMPKNHWLAKHFCPKCSEVLAQWIKERRDANGTTEIHSGTAKEEIPT